MDTVISEYQKWKQHGESLRVQARQAMEVRYRDLLTEAMRIAQEYHSDFGVALKPPPSITAFRYKAAAGKAKKAVKTSPGPVRPTADPKVSALEKKLAQTRGKMEAARAAGKPTKNLDDRIYEIEDEIRLAAPGRLMRSVILVCFAFRLFAAESLVNQPQVKQALAYIEANNDKTLASQVTIAEIPAPTFQEARRAEYMASEFRRVGLTGVEIDKQGNVLGWREGELKDTLVLAAHLDISFAPGVNTKVRKEAKRWFGPGLGDDSRGLAALLTIAEAMNSAAIRTHQTVLFVANVGEEGLGDLNGVRYLFQESPYKSRLREFISMDGADPSRIVTGGTGVKRYRVILSGPGGHSYGNFGRPSAIHAAGRIIDLLADMEVPRRSEDYIQCGPH